MAKEIFGFEINDSEKREHKICMFYTREGNTLIPTHEDFLRTFSTLSYDQGMEFLRRNGVKNVTTFEPDSEIVASAPYELGDEDDFIACEEDGLWNRFYHEEIFKGSELERILKESGISVRSLSPEEKRVLTEKLEYAYGLD